MSQYPLDEFDKVPESASRQGVHRERLVPPRSSGLALKIVVGVLALAVGLAAYLILPRLGIGEGSESAAVQTSSAPAAETTPEASPSEPAASESATPTPPSDPTGSDSVEDDSVDGGTGAGESGTDPSDVDSVSDVPEASEPVPTVDPLIIDRTQPVNVYNSTGIGGLASATAGRVIGSGWAVGQIADWSGIPPQTSVIFYNNPSQLAAAQEVAGLLGIPALVESPEVSPNLTVVIGPGFQ